MSLFLVQVVYYFKIFVKLDNSNYNDMIRIKTMFEIT